MAQGRENRAGRMHPFPIFPSGMVTHWGRAPPLPFPIEQQKYTDQPSYPAPWASEGGGEEKRRGEGERARAACGRPALPLSLLPSLPSPLELELAVGRNSRSLLTAGRATWCRWHVRGSEIPAPVDGDLLVFPLRATTARDFARL